MEEVSKILVDNGEKGKLAKLLDCTYPTVRAALKGGVLKRTALHLRIRNAAIERGGIEVAEVVKK
jgi:hypothetical protein